jgi:hypothetical protein
MAGGMIAAQARAATISGIFIGADSVGGGSANVTLGSRHTGAARRNRDGLGFPAPDRHRVRADMINLAAAAPIVAASFLASTVEAVEAFTIVLAVSVVRGVRRSARSRP